MTISFTVNGAQAVVPGVYSYLLVQDSLPQPAPAGQTVIVIGEGEEGIPSDLLDLSLNYFDNYPDVLAYYKSGSIVDAARMAFTKQPSPVFTGAVQRLYIYKTNQSTQAAKVIASPANYGSIVAGAFGVSGNMIKTQITNASTEVLPSETFQYLPDPAASTFALSVNGVRISTVTMTALQNGNDLAGKLTVALGANATVSGGVVRSGILSAATDLTVSASGDVLTFTCASGFGTAPQAGDVALIPVGSLMAGAANANAGVYSVISWSDTVISLQQLKHFLGTAEVTPVAFDVSSVTAAVAASISVVSPVSVVMIVPAGVGLGASMEFGVVPGDAVNFSEMTSIISSNSAAVGQIAAVATGSSLSVSLSSGASWSVIPSSGDQVFIGRASPLSASLGNVGLWTVVSATGQTLVLQRVQSVAAVSVSAVAINGSLVPVLWAPGFASSSIAALQIESSAERQVSMNAIRVTDNSVFPNNAIGGVVALELGYTGSFVTGATVSIDQNRILTISVDGHVVVSVLISRFPTMQSLADYLNAQSNVVAVIPDARVRAMTPTVLDMVLNANMASAMVGVPSTPARIKKDYYDFVTFMSNNFGLIGFAPGALVLKAGLPAAEASFTFLVNGSLGGSSNADIQAGFDAALKVDAQNVVPLFSRDAFLDAQDGLTDNSSSYTVSSIIAAAAAHASTASGDLARRYRYVQTSFHGSFADAMQVAGSVGYERDQMSFQMFKAIGSDGNLDWFLPWMGSMSVATSRAQGAIATSLLRKPISVSAVKHIGNESVYSDTLVLDFDPEDQGMLSQAIEAGLLVWRSVSGQGVRMESPDLTTRSRINDPQAWVWERANVLTALDSFRLTCQSVLDNFIGNRTTDTPAAVVQKAIESVISSYVAQGALKKGSVNKITNLGNGYSVDVGVYPPEAVEVIVMNVTAQRDVTT